MSRAKKTFNRLFVRRPSSYTRAPFIMRKMYSIARKTYTWNRCCHSFVQIPKKNSFYRNVTIAKRTKIEKKKVAIRGWCGCGIKSGNPRHRFRSSLTIIILNLTPMAQNRNVVFEKRLCTTRVVRGGKTWFTIDETSNELRLLVWNWAWSLNASIKQIFNVQTLAGNLKYC